MNEPTREITVTAYPYAVQSGTIKVPAGMKIKDVRRYVEEHWDEIDFRMLELDYAGTDYDIEVGE